MPRQSFIKKIKVRADSPSPLHSPLETRALALQPSDPIQENCPVAFFLFTAFISSATSWSEPNTITPDQIKDGDQFRELDR